jgi:molecular chaperone DnaK
MSEPTPKDPRGPTNLRIKFRSASLDQFIARYAVDVSRGGIFIRTREPLAVGTRLKLEFQLQDAAPLLAGEGTVVWIRENDPARENVTPGMGVRFDKLTPESQPTLEKILAEKTRLEQAGVAPTAQANKGGGIAVRRPSGVFASLETNARAVFGTAAGGESASTSSAASGPESTPIAVPPAPTVPAVAAPAVPAAIPKTSFLGSRSGAPTAPVPAAPSGPFTRARSTTTRPVPVPSALFEPPSAADIDKALEALEEVPGPAPAARPTPSVPRYVADDASNEPTRVADIVDELVGGQRPIPGSLGTGSTPMTERLGTSSGVPVEQQAAAASGSAAALDAPLDVVDVADVEPAIPEKQAVVQAPAAADPSKRFRAASRAYPTLNKRKRGMTGFVVVAILLAAGIGAAIKLHLTDRLFRHPAPPSPIAASPPAAPPPAAPTTAETAPAQPAAPAAPEGAGGSGAVAAQPAAPEKAAPAAPEEKPAPEKPAAEPKKPVSAEKSAAPAGNEERGGGKRRPLKRHAEAEAAGKGTAGATTPAAEKPAAEKPAEAAAEKPAAEKPAEAAAEKPAAEKPAEAAAEKPAAAAPPPPVLKITSTPSGAQVLIDGKEVGTTPFLSKEIDPASPHAITIKKDGFEASERMVSGLDWSRPHGNSPQTLKVNAKLHRSAASPAAPAATPAAPKENAEPEDTGGPYIKEIKPDSP